MLTREQKLQDHEYFWHILETCWPVKGPAIRSGIDWEGAKERSRKAACESKDDLEFFKAMVQIHNDMKMFCHLWIFDPAARKYYQDLFSKLQDMQQEKDYSAWAEPLLLEAGDRFHEQFDEAHPGLRMKGEEYVRPAGAAGKPEEELKFAILKDGKVAYLYIRDLDMMRLEEDRPKIFNFLQEIKDYDHLILDFRRNGGGATDYWRKLLVAPTIKEPLAMEAYMGFIVNDETRRFVMNDEDTVGRVRPISELPELPNLVKEELAPLTHFVPLNHTVEPDPEHRGFTGKVWMLVSPRVYSSAESFAVFAKNSGWATLVGSRTGGDGIGITPFHYAMPNSGICWRISAVYGINPDGSCNQVDRTTPHIECEPNEALGRCLMEIEKYEEEHK